MSGRIEMWRSRKETWESEISNVNFNAGWKLETKWMNC